MLTIWGVFYLSHLPAVCVRVSASFLCIVQSFVWSPNLFDKFDIEYMYGQRHLILYKILVSKTTSICISPSGLYTTVSLVLMRIDDKTFDNAQQFACIIRCFHRHVRLCKCHILFTMRSLNEYFAKETKLSEKIWANVFLCIVSKFELYTRIF